MPGHYRDFHRYYVWSTPVFDAVEKLPLLHRRKSAAHVLAFFELPHLRPEDRPFLSESQSNALQALFAFLDGLTKTVLTCLPEPAGEAYQPAVARARAERFLKSVGANMP
jgi:hypothetical protein